MKKKNTKKQSTFSSNKFLVYGLVILALLVLGLLYFVASQKYITATDSTKHFTYEYPDDWAIEPYEWEDCCEGTPEKEPNWDKETKPITLYPKKDKQVLVTINAVKYQKGEGSFESFDDVKAFVKEDYFAKILFEGKRVDGHEALFARVDYLGPPDAKVESFTDHRYYFDDGKQYLVVEFREKYHHDWPDDETGPDINNTKYKNDFEHIANSIKFSN